MGYNTTVFILNDRIHDIQRDPEEFVNDIVRHMPDGTDHALGQTTVMKTGHADWDRLYFSGSNWMLELTPGGTGVGYYRESLPFQRELMRGRIASARRMLTDLEKQLDEIDASE